MDVQEIRLECLRLAVGTAQLKGGDVGEIAGRYVDLVLRGPPRDATQAPAAAPEVPLSSQGVA